MPRHCLLGVFPTTRVDSPVLAIIRIAILGAPEGIYISNDVDSISLFVSQHSRKDNTQQAIYHKTNCPPWFGVHRLTISHMEASPYGNYSHILIIFLLTVP